MAEVFLQWPFPSAFMTPYSCCLVFSQCPRTSSAPWYSGLASDSPDVEVESRSHILGAKRISKGPLDHYSNQMLEFLQMCSHEVASVLECLQCWGTQYLQGQHIPSWEALIVRKFLHLLGGILSFWSPLPFVPSSISWVHTSSPSFPELAVLVPSRMWFQSLCWSICLEYTPVSLCFTERVVCGTICNIQVWSE